MVMLISNKCKGKARVIFVKYKARVIFATNKVSVIFSPHKVRVIFVTHKARFTEHPTTPISGSLVPCSLK